MSATHATRELRDRCAMIVIHGVGQQGPFETLNDFGRGLYRELGGDAGKYGLRHRVAHRVDAQGTPWIEHFLRIYSKADPDRCYLDVHEYYWAYLFQRTVTSKEVLKWIEEVWGRVATSSRERASLSAQFGYDPHPVERQILPHMQRIRLRYWRMLLGAARALASSLGWMPAIKPFLDKVVERVKARLDPVLIDYLGDVAIYTSTNPLKAEHATRQKALNGAVAFATAVIDSGEADRVILAGHSLGSVIAYDTINRLVTLTHAGQRPKDLHKLAGLVTFGSPLDRTLLYFLHRAEADAHLRLRILEQIHSFRTRNFYDFYHKDVGRPLEADWLTKLEHVRWLNFWNERDPIASELVFYQDVRNVHLEVDPADTMGAAHSRYWNDPAMYAAILDEVVAAEPTTAESLGRRAEDHAQLTVVPVSSPTSPEPSAASPSPATPDR